jgi:hypothetical protein
LLQLLLPLLLCTLLLHILQLLLLLEAAQAVLVCLVCATEAPAVHEAGGTALGGIDWGVILLSSAAGCAVSCLTSCLRCAT